MTDTKSQKNKPQKIIPLDGDKLGMIGGLLGATCVLVISFLFQSGGMITTLIRMGWVFVACYGATFFLVRMILRTTLVDMIEQEKRLKQEQKDEKDAKARSAAEAVDTEAVEVEE